MGAVQDKAGKETNGFKSRMGARGPAPRLLRLKIEDTTLTRNAPLTKGKFTWITQAGFEERWIVANCGNYTVLWNFRWVVFLSLCGVHWTSPVMRNAGFKLKGITTCVQH